MSPLRLFSSLALLATALSLHSARPVMERLDRGVVAIQQSDGKVFVSWRLLANDAPDTAFNPYAPRRPVTMPRLRATQPPARRN